MIEPKFKVEDLIMTKEEEKELLLKDLSARVPYGVMFDYNDNEPLKVEGIVRSIVYFRGYNYQTGGDECYAYITKCKPYLRPMSSMTDKEREEWADLFMKPICELEQYIDEKEAQDMAPILYGKSHSLSIDWLNKRHFDYHGLIERGLALIAPKNMYNHG